MASNLTRSDTAVPLNRRSIWSYLRRDWMFYAMMVPGIIYFLTFKYWPIYGVSFAFRDYNIFTGAAPWMGTEAFERLFSLPGFWRAFRNNVIISFAKLIFGFPAPIILSLLINEVAHRHYKKLVQTSVLLPSFISWVIIGGLMLAILSPNSGVLQAALEWFGYRGRIVNLMASKEHFRGVIVATYVWRQWGVGTIIYLAAIASIDPQLYEAATIDGAGRWRQLFSITLPSLRLTIIILLILRVGDLMEAGFEQIFAIYNPLVYEVAEIIDTYVYKVGLVDRNFSLATAAGLFKSVIGLVMVLGANWVAKRIDRESGLI